MDREYTNISLSCAFTLLETRPRFLILNFFNSLQFLILIVAIHSINKINNKEHINSNVYIFFSQMKNINIISWIFNNIYKFRIYIFL
jgi:hypothetical protein